MTTALETAKAGDVVALIVSCGWADWKTRKAVITRATKTRLVVEGLSFTRGGREVPYRHRSPQIEAWSDEIHKPIVEAERVRDKLANSRRKLEDYNWREISQEKANAVLAVLYANAGEAGK